jgi:tetratricopeptide (TPR) repeat protein
MVIGTGNIPWLSLKDMEEIDPAYDKEDLRIEFLELSRKNEFALKKFRNHLTKKDSILFIHENPVGQLFQVKNQAICISLLLRIVKNSKGELKLLLLDSDTTASSLNFYQLAKKFESRNNQISTLYYQRLLQENISLYTKRNIFLFLAEDAENSGFYNDAISLYRKVIQTDVDSFLVAASAYKRMELIFRFQLNDTIQANDCESKVLAYLETAIKLNPKFLQPYIDLISFYKYSSISQGKEEFFKLIDKEFIDEPKISFALANYYLLGDFLFKENAGYDRVIYYLNKTISNDPNFFNAYLLLISDNTINVETKRKYLNIMCRIAPLQFSRNHEQNSNKLPFVITSINGQGLGKEIRIFLSKNETECLSIKE